MEHKRIYEMIVTSPARTTIGEFPARTAASCRFGMFNRHGGVSSDPFGSLNVGHGLGDSPTAVEENRRRVKESMGIARLLSARQVHGRGIYCLTDPLAEDCSIEGVDALITDLADVGLMIQQADCQAVLLFDPIREVIGAVHCGWRGSVQLILVEAVEAMVKNYGTNPSDLHAAVSPSLGPCCAEFVNYKRELPADFLAFTVRDNYFDFWQISRAQLVSAGVMADRIRIEGSCTCCSDDYFSYRRAARQGGPTGRNCSVIALRRG
jgi:hypothetical protein